MIHLVKYPGDSHTQCGVMIEDGVETATPLAFDCAEVGYDCCDSDDNYTGHIRGEDYRTCPRCEKLRG